LGILRSVHFLDAFSGFAVGDGQTLLKTRDGGATWSKVSGTRGTPTYNCIYFSDALNGWIVGDANILATKDGGGTWTVQAGALGSPLYGVHFVDALTGWAVGNAGTILATTDGGSTWLLQPGVQSNTLRSISFRPPRAGYIVGFSTVLQTYDYRLQGWTPTSISIGGVPSGFLYDVDASFSTAVGEPGIMTVSSSGAQLRHDPGVLLRPLYGVHYADASHGWAVGANGAILGIRESAIWTPQSSGTSDHLYSVYFVSASTGWAVGGAPLSGGLVGNTCTILKTTTGGW
jgi:photosystem II stability/assembly factor-like uncharacterized protein